jgi:hypothetical protein
MKAYSIAPNTTVVFDLSVVVNATEVVSGLQGTSAAITASIHGVVFP